MSGSRVIKIRLALMGRPLRSYTFDKDVITVGRDPDADIFLDNPGISREHLRLERDAKGEYLVVDLGSANGTYINDDRVQKAMVRHEDVVRIGKFSLWVSFGEDRRAAAAQDERRISSETYQATTVLSSGELGKMMLTAREREAQESPAAHPAAPVVMRPAAPTPPRTSTAVAVLAGFLAGTALGVGATWLLMH